MSTIFISHSSADNVLAKELETRLRQQGHTCVFLDLDPEKGIVAGRSWERTLYRKLRACRAVIALCTDTYLQSQWCFAEVALARMEGKQILAMLANPLAADAKLPSILTEKQFIDLRQTPEDGYRRLWRALKELDLLGAIGDWDPRQSPYLGLNAYHEEQAPVFFGREDEVRLGVELLDRGAPGMVMVLGASGSGKSSLARAGILPRLRRTPDHWLIVDPFRPGRDPFSELAQALSQAFRRYAPDAPANTRDVEIIRQRLIGWTPRSSEPRGDRLTDTPPDNRLTRLLDELEALKTAPGSERDTSLMDFLNWSLEDLRRITGQSNAPAPGPARATPLVDLAAQLRRAGRQPNARVLVVIDQFEELLGQAGAAQDARRILDLLAATLAVESSLVTVFVTMRSDFLESFQQANARLGIEFETISLGPIPVEGIRRVIEAPAKLGAIELETGLADRLLRDASTADALPLLSFTLWLMWRDCHDAGKLTLSAYDALGGLNGAVAGEADAILRSAQRENRIPALRAAFQKMVRLADDGQFARQPVAWDAPELVPVHDLLETFVDRRLLVVRADAGLRVVEVAHEALFRTWAPLRQWTEEQRAELALRQQLRQASTSWARDGRKADELWRGARLAQAAALLESGGLDGQEADTKTAKAFVRASEAMRIRQSRRRRVLALTITLLLLGFSGFAIWNEDSAKRSQRQSWAQQQSLRAISEIGRDPLQGIAYAQSAICITQAFDGFVLPDAHDALNRAVQAAQRRQHLAGHRQAVTDVQFLPGAVAAPDTQRLISLGSDRSLNLWRLAQGPTESCRAMPAPLGLSDAALTVAMDLQGRLIVAADDNDLTVLWLGDNATPVAQTLQLFGDGGVAALAVAPEAQHLAAAKRDGAVIIAAITEAGKVSPDVIFIPGTAAVTALAFGADGNTLAVGTASGSITLLDSATGRSIATLAGHQEAVTAFAFSGDVLASGSWDKTVAVWDIATGARQHAFGHDAMVSALAFAPDGVLASVSWDRTVRLWNIENGNALGRLDQAAALVSLAIAPHDGPDSGSILLATGDWDGRTTLWQIGPDRETAAVSRLVARQNEAVNALAFSADGGLLASASDDQSIIVTRLKDRHADLNWQTGLDLRQFGTDGTGDNWIAIITGAGVQLLDAATGTTRRLVTGYDGNAEEIAFSSDGGKKLVIRANDMFEYYLDPAELMNCADGLTGREPVATLSDRCATTDFDDGFQSLWSLVTTAADRLR